MHSFVISCISINPSQNLWKLYLAVCDLIDSLLWIFIPLTNHEDEDKISIQNSMIVLISVLGEIELFMCCYSFS